MALDLAVLKTEITTDPERLGYAGKEPEEQAKIINTPGSASGDIPTEEATAEALQTRVVATEFLSLTDAQRDLWSALLVATGDTGADLRSARIREQINAIWADGTTTRANLLTLQSKPAAEATRAEELFGEGFEVTFRHITRALAS